MSRQNDQLDWVGPVLQPGPLADAVVAAIRELNAGVEVIDRGGYLRVRARGRCRLARALVEGHRGQPFHLPSDLESIMSSFQGKLTLSEDEAIWERAGGRQQ